MRRGIALVCVVVGLVLAALPAGAPAAERPATVTLVTGDRVTLLPPASGEPRVLFEPAPGSEPTGFDVHRDGTHVYVVPNDVAALVPDVLDPALFDVAGLVEMGYDDRRAGELPLIVRRAAGGRALPLRAVTRLESLRATAVELDKDDADELGAGLRGVSRIWLDRPVEAAELDRYLTQVKAPAAWSAGLDGAGVTVAVLDSGVDDGHPALAGQVSAHANFTDTPFATDAFGHGTHVASLVAGTGAGSEGARQGIAPGADVLSGKVLGDDGRGQESWVIAGMEWAAAQGADVVNLSLGGSPAPVDDPLVRSLDALTAETGTLFVVAAGNRGGFGPNPFTIESPGSAASALTVSAVTGTDGLALFASEGPTLGSHRLKPDVTAPGVGILGARTGAADYLAMSGTSQATPIVAGAAALLMQQHPAWTWRQVKAQIVGTADQASFHSSWTHGGGRLDLDQATHQNLTADVATLDFGSVRHPDDAPKTRTVTLANDGAEPVSLVVTDQQTGETGAAAPDGALVASPAALTVPAGGTATTTVTLDPGLLEDGHWEGGMTFSAGGTALLRLPFGVYDEPERYDLDVQVLDRNGEPYDPSLGAEDPNGDTTIPIFNGTTGGFYRLRPDASGHATARVEPGSYSIFARIITPAGGGKRETFTIAGTPALEVDSDTEYVIDARDARRLDPPRVHGQQTEPRLAVGITYSRESPDGRGYTEFGFFDPQEVAGGRVHITPTSTVRSGSFETTFRWRLVPTGRIEPSSPDAYELLMNAPRFPDPLSRPLTARDVADLAQVDTQYRPVGPPGEDYLAATVYETVETGIGFVYRNPQAVPGSTRVLMTAAPDVLWGHCLAVPANGFRALCDDLHAYDRRERVQDEFGAALHPEVFSTFHSDSSLFVQTGLSDGAHTSSLLPETAESSRFTLFKDGELVATREGVFAFFAFTDEPGRFRLEQEWTLTDGFPRSRQARTVWTYDSAPGAAPSFIPIDYGAEVDELGRAAPHKPLRLNLRFGTVNRIEEMRLRWSDDGGDNWHPATAARTGQTTFRAAIPGLASGRQISLRVVAVDPAESEVDQTVYGIVPVR